MAIAGYCSHCGDNVYLTDQWGCPRGHPWNVISGWYDTDTGQPVTPYWLQQAAAPAAPAPVASAPVPEPAPEPEPVRDPAEVLRESLAAHIRALNLPVSETDGVLSVARGEEYSAAIRVDGAAARIVLWEQLRSGHDPGVRDAARSLASNGWTLKLVLRRDAVTS